MWGPGGGSRAWSYKDGRAFIAYRGAQYEELLEKRLDGAAARQRWQLLWPR